MKTFITIISALLISAIVSGQFDFRADKHLSKQVNFIADTTKERSYRIRLIDSLLRLEKDYAFQFRFYEQGMSVASVSLFVMTLHDNKWSARYFQPNKNRRNDGKLVTEITIDQSKLNQLWELLVVNNVLTLPSQEAIEASMVKYTIDTTNLGYGGDDGPRRIDLHDGIKYDFELSSGTALKHYRYHCPQFFQNEYKHIPQLYYASKIILLIKHYLHLTNMGC